MSETPDTDKAAPSFIELFGMEVKVSDIFPADFFGVAYPGEFYALRPLASATPGIEPMSAYTVANHAAKTASYEIDEADLLDMPHFMDDLREARLREFERQYLGKLISTSNASTETKQSVTAEDIFADITRIFEQMKAKQRQQDMDLIRACLEAGFHISVSNMTDQPRLTVPETMRDAYDAVIKEKIAERLGNLNDRHSS